MHFVLICRDAPGSPEKRPKVRAAHLEYWRPLDEAGRLLLVGPMTDFAGSLIVLEAPSREEVARLAAEDPYYKEGVFEAFEIHPFRPVLPRSHYGGA